MMASRIPLFWILQVATLTDLAADVEAKAGLSLVDGDDVRAEDPAPLPPALRLPHHRHLLLHTLTSLKHQ